MHNDPFLAKIRLEENHEDVNYEQIYLTSKSHDFKKKRLSQIPNEVGFVLFHYIKFLLLPVINSSIILISVHKHQINQYFIDLKNR